MPVTPPFAAFVALPREAARLRAAVPALGPAHLTVTGMCPESASTAAARTLASAVTPGASPTVVLALGVCGALDHGVALGEVIVGEAVVWAGGPGRAGERGVTFRCDARLVEAARAAALAAGVTVRSGRLASTDHMLLTAAEKGALGSASGCVAADMESAAIARAAADARLPFLALRAVSDLATEDLWSDLPRIVTPWGGLHARGLVHVLLHPSRIPGLNRLRRQTNQALENLARVLRGLLACGGDKLSGALHSTSAPESSRRQPRTGPLSP